MCLGEGQVLAPQPGSLKRELPGPLHVLVLEFDAWSPCPAQPCSWAAWEASQPTSLPRPESGNRGQA